jgi:hypothetical protein
MTDLRLWLIASSVCLSIFGCAGYVRINQNYDKALPEKLTAAILKSGAGRRAIIVGEKIGDDLQFWSEGGFLVLPNSGLRIHYSDGYHDWEMSFDGEDPRRLANPRMAAVNQRYSAAAGSLDPDRHCGGSRPRRIKMNYISFFKAYIHSACLEALRDIPQ